MNVAIWGMFFSGLCLGYVIGYSVHIMTEED